MGPFGIFWTAIAAQDTFINFNNEFTDKGISAREIIIADTNTVVNTKEFESHLAQLESLYNISR